MKIPVASRREPLADGVVKTTRVCVLDPGVRGPSRAILNARSSKHAMFRTIYRQTIAVGHTHIQRGKNFRGIDTSSFMNDVIPWDTSTATVATTKMVFGMFRHHYRMVPVASLAGNLSRHGP